MSDFKNQTPWGSPPGGGNGGRGPTPPDIDEIIKNIQKTINKFLPGGKSGGGKPIVLGLIILILLWLASGLYRVLPDEQGIVLRFGKLASNILSIYVANKLAFIIIGSPPVNNTSVISGCSLRY